MKYLGCFQSKLSYLVILSVWSAICIKFAFSFAPSPDELMHLVISGSPSLSEMLARAGHEVHPPGAYILRFILFQVSSDFLLQRVFSILLIFLALLVFANLFPRADGNIYLALLSFSPLLMMLSPLVRNYPMLLFFEAGLLYFYINAMSGKSWSIFFYLIAASSVIWVHLTGGLLVAATLPILLLQHWKERKIDFVLISLLVFPICSFVLMLICMTQSAEELLQWYQFFKTNPHLSTISSTEQMSLWLRFISLFYGFYSKNPFVILSLIILFCHGLWLLQRSGHPMFKLTIILLLIQILLAHYQLYPLTGTRYCLHLLPILSFVISSSLAQIISPFGRWLPPLTAASYALLAIVFYYLSFDWNPELTITNTDYSNYRSSISSIQPADIVITNKAAALDSLYQEHGSGLSYDILSGGELSTIHGKFYYPKGRNYWENFDVDRYTKFLREFVLIDDIGEKVTVLVLKQTDFGNLSLIRCVPPVSYESGSAWIIAHISSTALKEFVSDSKRLSDCFANSQVPRLTESLTAKIFSLPSS
jgi:hypothetical protein